MNSDIPRKRPTIHDVARLAGLSTATVSRYINGTAIVSGDGAARILQAIEELHYLPHTGARGLASNRTQTLGLLLPTVSGSFFGPLLSGVETRAVEAGYSLLVHCTQLTSQTPFKKILAEHNTDGLLVFARSLDDSELLRLASIGFPAVMLHQTSPANTNFPCVMVDNHLGTVQLMDHLINFHHRSRIVHLLGEENHEDANFRAEGYRNALKAHHIAYDPELVIMGSFDTNVARQSMLDLINKRVQFDAVFAADDESASGVMMALREARYWVPEDVSVAGFDDLNIAIHLTPPLTTVHSPIEQVAYQATDLLIRSIAGEKVPAETRLPTRLVVRSSCGCSW